jgi:hypothetical protein
MKFVEPSGFADPEVAARKLVEIANASEAEWPHRLSATFFLACLAAMELEGVVLEEI